jgi:hypothetical protein
VGFSVGESDCAIEGRGVGSGVSAGVVGAGVVGAGVVGPGVVGTGVVGTGVVGAGVVGAGVGAKVGTSVADVGEVVVISAIVGDRVSSRGPTS